MWKFVGILLVSLAFNGCFNYSVIDGSIDAENFSVSIFEEQAANAPVGYGSQFTEYLKDFIISRSALKLTTAEPDIEISGKITGYSVNPVAVQSNETAAQNRLTITMLVSVINNKTPEESFEQRFSQFSDFSSSSDLSNVEGELLDDINAKLGQDIINKLTSNW